MFQLPKGTQSPILRCPNHRISPGNQLWIDLGVSIVMGVPQNRWFRMEHPSINGRFAGTPMSGNPHFEEIQWMAIISKDFSEFSGHYVTEIRGVSAGGVWANQGFNENMSNKGYFQVFLELSIPFRMSLIARNCDH